MNEFVNEEMHEEILRLVCHIYGKKSTSCLNELCYQIYCQKGRKTSCELLPPMWRCCKIAIRQFYQATIW